ncbi:RES domain-containing protein [Rhizobium leguminosarum]|nr:RES domain-containing protein [Rhizobium leguminosarum]
MSAQHLDRTLTSVRIGDPAGTYPIFDATGSTIAPGRWNTSGSPIIYTSEHYSTALLEKLVHGSGRLPPNRHYVTVTIPRGLTYEVFSEPSLPGWDSMPAGPKRRRPRRPQRADQPGSPGIPIDHSQPPPTCLLGSPSVRCLMRSIFAWCRP